MKRIFKTALLLAVATLSVACSKEKPIVNETAETINVSIDGIMGTYSESAETKGEIQTVARLMWNDGDKVYAYEGTTYAGELTASITETDGTYAKLLGEITAPSGEKPITLVHSPLFAKQPEVADGKISLNFSHQNADNLPFLVYSVLPAGTTAEELNNTVVKFTIATAIYKCNIAGLPQNDCSIFNVRVTNTNTVCNLQLSDSEEPVVTGSDPGTIYCTAGIYAKDQRALTTFALVPSSAKSDRKIEVFKAPYLYVADFSNSAIAPAKSFSGIFAFDGVPYYIENDANLGKSIAVLGDWNNDGTQTTLYWAPVNCGYEEAGEVNTVSDHRLGKLYQWGAGDSNLYKDPHVEARVLYYDTATPSPWYSANEFEAASKPDEKWLNDRGPCPDGWRLPTLNEFKVLCEGKNSKHGWVDEGTYAGNTYTGAEFFGANADKTAGKGVFFPTAGYRRWQEGTAIYFGSYGKYWASTPVSASTPDLSEEDKSEEWWKNLSEYMSEDANGIQTYVYYLEFDKWPNSETTHLCPHAYGTRSSGHSVRCVSDNTDN